MLMSRYFPHYLGARDKYSITSRMIEKSGLLVPEAVEEYQRVFRDRTVTHAPIRELPFRLDKIQHPETFREQPNVATIGDSEVFYPALLFEDIHFKKVNND